MPVLATVSVCVERKKERKHKSNNCRMARRPRRARLCDRTPENGATLRALTFLVRSGYNRQSSVDYKPENYDELRFCECLAHIGSINNAKQKRTRKRMDAVHQRHWRRRRRVCVCVCSSCDRSIFTEPILGVCVCVLSWVYRVSQSLWHRASFRVSVGGCGWDIALKHTHTRARIITVNRHHDYAWVREAILRSDNNDEHGPNVDILNIFLSDFG